MCLTILLSTILWLRILKNQKWSRTKMFLQKNDNDKIHIFKKKNN